jgi:hypothetical protein
MYFKIHMAYKEADEPFVCSDNIWQFLQTCIIMLKMK